MKSAKSFVAGFTCATLLTTGTITALAASGKLNISVTPGISIKVNGEVFKPKTADGKDAMVFEYNGTTYAPLRALAEAYGLQVVWDQSAKMATVDEKNSQPDINEPDLGLKRYYHVVDSDEYESFKDIMLFDEKRISDIGHSRSEIFYKFKPSVSGDKFSEYWDSISCETKKAFVENLAIDTAINDNQHNTDNILNFYFICDDYPEEYYEYPFIAHLTGFDGKINSIYIKE